MKVSIITVCFNSEKTIKYTFDSVRNQIYKNIELIVVDGGSIDGTLDIIESNNDIISKMISETDNGLYDAMNKGIQMAKGDIIGILNSDDIFYDNDVIKNLVQFHKTNDVDISIGNIVQHKTNGKIKRVYLSQNWSPIKLKKGLMPPHPSMFVSSKIYEKFDLYKLNYKIAADYELMIRYFLIYNINWLYSGITTTSMLAGGVSSSGFKSYIQVSKDIIKGFKENNIKVYNILIYLRVFIKLKDLLKMK